MVDLVARRDGSDLVLFADGFRFGRLADCEVCHVFESNDEELEGFVAHRIEGDMSVREMLAEVRAGYEAYSAFVQAEAKAEAYAEGAWLRHAERYDPEAQADLALHDFLHPDGYC